MHRPVPTTGGLTVTTAPHTNKRAAAAAAKNLLAARITLVEELGDALDAHSKASVAAAAQARQDAEKTADAARTAFEAAKAGGWTTPELNSTGLHAPAAPRGRRATRDSVPTNTQGSAEPTTAGDSPA